MHHTDTDYFLHCVERTIATLPEPFRAAARQVVVSVVDWPSQDMLDELGIEDRHDLTGLYEGVPLIHKSVLDQPIGPDTIWLFRRPILAEWHHRGDVELPDLIAHVFIHELAHHFGWTDDDIARIDRWWE